MSNFTTVQMLTAIFEPLIVRQQKINILVPFAERLVLSKDAIAVDYDNTVMTWSEHAIKLQMLQTEIKVKKSIREEKTRISLPQKEMESAFIFRLSYYVAIQSVDLFFEPSSHKIVEITEWHDKQKNRYLFGKRFVDSLRIKSILEDKFIFTLDVKSKDGLTDTIEKSPSKALLEFTMTSDAFRNSLRKLSGVFESPFLYIKEGEIKVTKNGYNEDCFVYVRKDAPEVYLMPVEEAKKWIWDCLIDFPFQTPQDKVFALSSIITPMLRGIYGQYGVRTPAYAWLGNQQGCGKDYGAGIRQIIFTGRFNEDSPLSNDKGSNSEEVQKEYVSAAMTGQQFMHNSNCRGRLENAAYEKQLTAASIRGRVLGTNTILDTENIIENSYSGNYGLSFNKDIGRRSLFINLFTEVEDTTKRKFTRNLHQWILENRHHILSAIYTLIKTWWDAGHKMGSGINASYPTWALFCSGVMEYHELGDPCASATNIINDVGGDSETKNISLFNQEIGDWLHNTANIIQNEYVTHAHEGLTKKEIFSLYEKVFAGSDDKPFGFFDLEVQKDRREFGRTLNKYVGTYRGGYKMVSVSAANQKLDRIKYKFVPCVPDVPNHTSPHMNQKESNEYMVRVTIDPLRTVRTDFGTKTDNFGKKVKDLLENLVTTSNNSVLNIDFVKAKSEEIGVNSEAFDIVLAELLQNGDYFVPKSGFICKTM